MAAKKGLSIELESTGALPDYPEDLAERKQHFKDSVALYASTLPDAADRKNFNNFMLAMLNAHKARLYIPPAGTPQHKEAGKHFINAARRFIVDSSFDMGSSFRTANGHVFVNSHSVSFVPEFNPATLADKKMTMQDAQAVAWHIAQRDNWVRPGKIKIDAPATDRRMVELAIREQNNSMPRERHIAVANPSGFEGEYKNLFNRMIGGEKADFASFMNDTANTGPIPSQIMPNNFLRPIEYPEATPLNGPNKPTSAALSDFVLDEDAFFSEIAEPQKPAFILKSELSDGMKASLEQFEQALNKHIESAAGDHYKVGQLGGSEGGASSTVYSYDQPRENPEDPTLSIHYTVKNDRATIIKLESPILNMIDDKKFLENDVTHPEFEYQAIRQAFIDHEGNLSDFSPELLFVAVRDLTGDQQFSPDKYQMIMERLKQDGIPVKASPQMPKTPPLSDFMPQERVLGSNFTTAHDDDQLRGMGSGMGRQENNVPNNQGPTTPWLQ